MPNEKHKNCWSPLLMYIGLLGLGLCWVPVVAGVVFLSQGYVGWGVILLIPAPLIMLGGGVVAWIAGNVYESSSDAKKKCPSE